MADGLAFVLLPDRVRPELVPEAVARREGCKTKWPSYDLLEEALDVALNGLDSLFVRDPGSPAEFLSCPARIHIVVSPG